MSLCEKCNNTGIKYEYISHNNQHIIETKCNDCQGKGYLLVNESRMENFPYHEETYIRPFPETNINEFYTPNWIDEEKYFPERGCH